MGMPGNAVAFSVHADLTESSLEDARSMICGVKEKNGDLNSDNDYLCHYTALRVASQNMGVAVMMRIYGGFMIEPSFTYSSDEWSLHDRTWNKKDKKWNEIIVWTEGA